MMKIKNAYIIALATILAFIPHTIVTAQTSILTASAQALLIDSPHAIVVKREIIPGIVTFTHQNSCYLKTAVYTNYLNNGTILSNPYFLAGSGQTIPEWRTEYKQPWKSQLTDYEGGESKVMLLQVGHHPSIPIQVTESSQKLLDAQTKCAVGAYRIFGRNLMLIRPLSQQQPSLNLPLNQGWERNFTY
jgi:hypothetical protein